MSSLDVEWNNMLEKAVAYQQDFYELLPDWTVYKKDNLKYLKQNIGYAIFGSPFFEKTEDSKDILNFDINGITNDAEINDLVSYCPNAESIINLISQKICEHGGKPGDDTIRCGIIYVMLFRNKTFTQCDVTKTEELVSMPVFKILKYNDNNDVGTQNNKNNEDTYTTWYVDIKGRIYKSWDDYMMTNKLPKCTMVFPKDGYYQPNPAFDIAPNLSVVWLIAQDSYACSSRSQIISNVNTTINAVAAGATIGLGITTLLSPAGPLVTVAGVATTGLSSLWTIGKCSADLYDRKIHEESISPLNKSCLSSWLGIAGSTICVAVNGGSILLRRATAEGIKVGMVSKTMYNTALVGSVSINLIGLGYQGIQIYNKFKEERNIDIQDIVYFGTHFLFFMNTIIDIKFAGDIIDATQGEILKNFEANLRDNNLRERYNYMRNKAATDYARDKTAQNAAVIRYIKKVDIKDVSQTSLFDNCFSKINKLVTFEQYTLKINGITLLDPMLFVADIVKGYLSHTEEDYEDRSNSHSVDRSFQIRKVLETLLSDLYTSRDCPSSEHLLTIPDFNPIIKEFKKMDKSENILPFIFNIAIILLKDDKRLEYLVEGCLFVWDYVKRNMREAGLEIYSSIEDSYTYNTSMKHIKCILVALYDAVNSMIHRFLNALYRYVHLTRKQIAC